MVTKQDIEFVIRPDGTVEFTVKGIKGSSCEDVARLFEELGKKTGDDNTSEYYEKDTETRVTSRRR